MPDVDGSPDASEAPAPRKRIGGCERRLHGTAMLPPDWVSAAVEARRARPAIPRSMSSGDTCVAPRYGNGLTTGYRIPGAEAFELEGMEPFYIDIDGFRLRNADIKGPESAPI